MRIPLIDQHIEAAHLQCRDDDVCTLVEIREGFADLCDYDLLRHFHEYQQQHAEIEAEHRSEVFAFGDSWPGARQQIDAGYGYIAYCRDWIECRRERALAGAVPVDLTVSAGAAGDDGIPF